MDISLDDLISHYDKTNFPYLNQAQYINQKYQTFTKKTADPSKNFSIVEFFPYMSKKVRNFEIKNVNLSQDSMKTAVEAKAFLDHLEESCIHEYLEDLGISSDEYALIYDYETVTTWCNPDRTKPDNIVFLGVKTYLVLFQETAYNLLRLTYEKCGDIGFDFDCKLGYKNDN